MLGIGEGSGAGGGHCAIFADGFAALEMGAWSGGCSFSTLGSGTGRAVFSLFFWALALPAFLPWVLSSAAAWAANMTSWTP